MSSPVPITIFFDLSETLIDNQEKRYSDSLDTLQILRERGYRLGLLSNQNVGTTVDHLFSRLQNVSLATYIEYALITISTEIPNNLGKPNKPIFDKALQKAGHPAASAQSIFVTENADHIAHARSYGWRAILKCNSGACQPADGECVTSLSGLLDLLPDVSSSAGAQLKLAPAPKLVDGLWAVPVDMQRITAILTFDAATSSAAGDATVEFKMGRHTGNPIFDLRQTITGAWLDGVALPLAKAADHNFGGGTDANLRVIESILAAGSTHNLRLTYQLGAPQASAAGSYQPSLVWRSGPRLIFNFGFTDLGAGRYLEAWVPANLIFDQFELVLELQILNTAVAHAVITNGAVAVLGANHWRVNFPSRFTALSPLLELRAQDKLASATDTVILPLSGENVTITAWNLPTDPQLPASQQSPASNTNLHTEINNIKSYLIHNENSTGPYAHGNRFTSFLHRGGMEYDGGNTTATANLLHETFHSWWARGIKPASQPDSWFDEAWTTYNDNGAVEAELLSATDPAVTLCPRNPWIRNTADGAYTEGYRFWKHIAALLGVNTLNTLLSDFYKQRIAQPLVTTTDIEEFLTCRTGNPQVVDAFHRFIYGFADPASTPDLWLCDDPAHPGTDQWAGRFWDSPDIWVRNADDGGITHQPPEYGQSNWFFARVRNRGTATVRHFVVTFNVKQFAGTEFTYPNDFTPCTAAASGFDLAPGASVIVKARWPKNAVPLPGAHACLLASVFTKGDHPIAGRHVWEHNNLAQKNLTIVNLKPDSLLVLPFVVSNQLSLTSNSYHLELIRPAGHLNLEASLMHGSPMVFKRVPESQLTPYDFRVAMTDDEPTEGTDCAGHVPEKPDRAIPRKRLLTSDAPELLAKRFTQGVEARFAGGETAKTVISVRRQEQLVIGLKLKVPPDARKGETLQLDLIQRNARSHRIMGGIAVRIKVI